MKPEDIRSGGVYLGHPEGSEVALPYRVSNVSQDRKTLTWTIIDGKNIERAYSTDQAALVDFADFVTDEVKPKVIEPIGLSLGPDRWSPQ